MKTLRDLALARMMHGVFLFSRGMTLGVRAACFDEKGRVFLVRHSYVAGWHLPGGGVERRETVLQALAKEIREEGNLQAVSPPELFHVYFNNGASKRDHVLLYKLYAVQTEVKQPDFEIVDSGFFSPHALPEGTTASTRRRLAELAGAAPPDDFW